MPTGDAVLAIRNVSILDGTGAPAVPDARGRQGGGIPAGEPIPTRELPQGGEAVVAGRLFQVVRKATQRGGELLLAGGAIVLRGVGFAQFGVAWALKFLRHLEPRAATEAWAAWPERASASGAASESN